MSAIKISGKLLFIILAVNFLFRIAIVNRSVESLDTYMPDDTFLSLKIAKNIAEGKGPLYGNSYTNGFQPMFVFMMVPAYIIYPHDLIIPLKIALILNSIFDTLTLLLLLKIILSLTRSGLAAVFASIFWIFNSYIISITMNGLETMISLFFLVWIIYYCIENSLPAADNIKPAKLFIFGLLGGAATFARIDNSILVFIIYLAISYNLLIKRRVYKQFLKTTLIILAGFLTIYSPWLFYSYIYTGLIYPISGKAVRFQTTYHITDFATGFVYYYYKIRHAVKIIFINNLAVWVSLIIPLIILILKGIFKTYLKFIFQNNVIILLTVFCLILAIAYIFYVPASWFYPRYLFPFAFLLILITSLILSKYDFSGDKFIVISILILFIIIESTGFYNKGIFYENINNKKGYINIGRWAQTAFPDSTVIGCSQSGAIGYFAENLKVFNLDGVVNEACYKSLVNKRNIEYIRSENIQYIIGWEINIKFIKNNSVNYREGDFVKIKTIPNITTWGTKWQLYKVNYGNNDILPAQ